MSRDRSSGRTPPVGPNSDAFESLLQEHATANVSLDAASNGAILDCPKQEADRNATGVIYHNNTSLVGRGAYKLRHLGPRMAAPRNSGTLGFLAALGDYILLAVLSVGGPTNSGTLAPDRPHPETPATWGP